MRRALLLIPLLLVAPACKKQTATTTPKATAAASPTAASSPTAADPVTRAEQFAGNWTGEWKNTTFGSKGNAKAAVNVDSQAKTITVVLDLDGSVFGESDPGPQTFTAPLDGSTTLSGRTDLTGQYTAKLSEADNTFTFEAPDVPSARIKSLAGSGKLEGKKFSATIKINFPDGTSAESTLELTKA